MNKKAFFKGFIIGLLAPFFVVLVFALILGGGLIADGFTQLVSGEQLDNTIRIGVLANCALFTLIINKEYDKIAQGILVATLLSLIYTLI